MRSRFEAVTQEKEKKEARLRMLESETERLQRLLDHARRELEKEKSRPKPSQWSKEHLEFRALMEEAVAERGFPRNGALPDRTKARGASSGGGPRSGCVGLGRDGGGHGRRSPLQVVRRGLERGRGQDRAHLGSAGARETEASSAERKGG